jgi:hypothetical protein
VEILLHGRGHKGEPFVLDYDTCRAEYLGSPVNLRQYVLGWGDQASREGARSFRSESVPEGRYQRAAHSRGEFAPGDLIVDDIDIEWAELDVRYAVRVVRPPLMSYLEVKSRGRVVTFAPVQFNDAVTMQTKLICP